MKAVKDALNWIKTDSFQKLSFKLCDDLRLLQALIDLKHSPPVSVHPKRSAPSTLFPSFRFEFRLELFKPSQHAVFFFFSYNKAVCE